MLLTIVEFLWPTEIPTQNLDRRSGRKGIGPVAESRYLNANTLIQQTEIEELRAMIEELKS